MTGSLRYAAPEVVAGRPYNDRADVYSFAVLLWEVLALERPYAATSHSEDLHIERVCEQHERPPVKAKWSPGLQEVLRRGWDPSVADRFSMEQVLPRLRTEVLRLRRGDDSGLGDLRRRSTHVFESSGRSEESMRELAMLAESGSDEK